MLQYLLHLTMPKQQLNLLNHWFVICLVTDRGSEYINTYLAHLCTLMGIRYAPEHLTPLGLVEVQSKNLRTQICMFLQNTP